MNIEKTKTLRPTNEQQAILDSTGDIKINSAPGTGKTTALKMLCENDSKPSLLLVFNRHNKIEIENKLKNYRHVKVNTIHSYAKSLIGLKGTSKIVSEHPNNKIIEVCKLDNRFISKKPAEIFAVVTLIKKCLSYYCSSTAHKVEDCKFEKTGDITNYQLIDEYLELIYQCTTTILSLMRKGELDLTYDYILKYCQLTGLKSQDFEVVYFDEAQDLNPSMLDIFLKQPGRKILSGDTHQSIYSWRHTVNALEEMDFQPYNLTRSFRFGSKVADVANLVLSWKGHLLGARDLNKINGDREYQSHSNTKAVISKYNHSAIIEAIGRMDDFNTCFFEGGHLYTYLISSQNISIYDLISLSSGNKSAIKHPLVLAVNSIDEMKSYGKMINDKSLLFLIMLVEQLGKDLVGVLSELRNKALKPEERDQADVVFSNVYKSKGFEYDDVTIGADFTSYKDLAKESERGSKSLVNVDEEINLLYVSITRSTGQLAIQKSLFEK